MSDWVIVPGLQVVEIRTELSYRSAQQIDRKETLVLRGPDGATVSIVGSNLNDAIRPGAVYELRLTVQP